MRIMPTNYTVSSINHGVQTHPENTELLFKKDTLSAASFKSAPKNAAKIIGGALAGTVISIATGGFGLLAPVIGSAIGAFTCESDKKDDNDTHSDYTSEYYP